MFLLTKNGAGVLSTSLVAQPQMRRDILVRRPNKPLLGYKVVKDLMSLVGFDKKKDMKWEMRGCNEAKDMMI
jgi:hypothetical protein